MACVSTIDVTATGAGGAESDGGATGGLAGLVKATLVEAAFCDIDRSLPLYGIEGMSGARYRRFINALVRRAPDPSYLEIGSWMGSTLCAAIEGNAVRALAIDNWSQFGGPKDAFLANVARFCPPEADIRFIEADFRQVSFPQIAAALPPFAIYLFDGPHAEEDQYEGLVAALPALAPEFVFICDDWNWQPVRAGTRRAIADAGLDLRFAAEIRTTLDGTHGLPVGKASDWHNGYFIAVLRKP